MTENIPQTSASGRIEEARALLAIYDRLSTANPTVLAEMIRALITPPAVGESEEAIAERIADAAGIDWDQAYDVALPAVREAIQSAHESWEPADVPSQEFMLRHLGIEYTAGTLDDTILHIHAQHIDKEVI